MIIDSSPFIDLDRGGKRLIAMIEEAVERDERIITSEGVLAQVFRDPSRQVRLSRLLNSGRIKVESISNGRAVGVALARSGTSDVVDGAVAVLAMAQEQTVLTSDTGDFSKFSHVRVAKF